MRVIHIQNTIMFFVHVIDAYFLNTTKNTGNKLDNGE
jgi:hypothetical protein